MGLMDSKTFHELFPTKVSFFIFISYMGLFINQGLLVTATKNKDNTYNYNPITVVLMTEALKLIMACSIYLKSFSLSQMYQDVSKNKNSKNQTFK